MKYFMTVALITILVGVLIGALSESGIFPHPKRTWAKVYVMGSDGKRCALILRRDDDQSVTVVNDFTCASVKQERSPW